MKKKLQSVKLNVKWNAQALWLSTNAYKTSLLVGFSATSVRCISNQMRLHVEYCRILFYAEWTKESLVCSETSQTKPNSDLKSQNNNSFMRCYLFRISSICSNALCMPICFSKIAHIRFSFYGEFQSNV